MDAMTSAVFFTYNLYSMYALCAPSATISFVQLVTKILYGNKQENEEEEKWDGTRSQTAAHHNKMNTKRDFM